MSIDVDLRVDLNTDDDTGVGSGRARAVAQVVQIDGDLVWVRPLPGPVSQYRELIGDGGAA